MKIKGINGYILVKRVEEADALGSKRLSEIFAIAHQGCNKEIQEGQKVIIDASERTIIDGFVLVKVENIKGVVDGE